MIAVLLMLLAAVAGAETRRVPADYPTIQEALNHSQDGDTVLVALGTYAEEVVVPPIAVLLRGDVLPDTGLYERPVIDPSTLPNPRQRSCLATSGGQPVIEDFWFRNRAPMYPHEDGSAGGIANNSSGLVVRRCVFDSTYRGVRSHGLPLTLEGCVFFDIAEVAVIGEQITATDCDFSGRCPMNLVRAGAGSTFLRCWFHDNTPGHLMLAYGLGVTVSHCVFGPFRSPYHQAIEGRFPDGLFEHNVFSRCRPVGSLISISGVCHQPTVFRQNHFVHDTSYSNVGIGIGRTEQEPCPIGLIKENIFEESWSETNGTVLVLGGGVRLERNRFLRLGNPARPAVFAYRDGAVARDNFFEIGGCAMRGDALIDAIWNWWGDSTGPYNRYTNPDGRGDSVEGVVQFDPWHRDTLFLSAPEPRRVLPQHATLIAAPNPFNAETTLRLMVPRPLIVRIELFNVLGQRVCELWSGAVANEQEVPLSARELASGIYFARATDAIFRHTVATCKLVVLK